MSTRSRSNRPVAIPATPTATRVRFATASSSGTLLGQHAPHVGGREAQLRDEQHGSQVARRVEPERLDAVVDAGGDREAAEQRGRGVVRMALDRRGEPEQVGGSSAARRAARCRRRARRPSPPRTTRGRAPAGSRCASRSASRRPPGSRRGPRAAPPRCPGCSGSSRSAVSSFAPSPSTVSSISPRLQPRTSTSTRLRQPEGEREAVVAGAEVRARRRNVDRDAAAVQLREPVRHHALVTHSPSQRYRHCPDRRLRLDHRRSPQRPIPPSRDP